MKFFTPDLLERYGSEDDGIAFAAHEELERRSQDYLLELHAIDPKLPQRFRELLERFYLHDARVIDHSSLGRADLGSPADAEKAGLGPGSESFGEEGPLLSFAIVLQLDTPPREVLVLQYRSVVIEEARRHHSLLEEDCPSLEWQHDEVELIQTGQRTEFRHSILFTRGLELRLRFQDFDFATLRPIEVPQELAAAGR
jgi:hypothetical protein